ncbi:MAG: putative sugar nucleotidyl transferase, partial [Flavobacteriales bacterium]
MQLVLFEDHLSSHFLPLTYTRPVGELRMGMLTMAERYARIFNTEVAHETRIPLRALFSTPSAQMQLHVNARLFPTASLINELRSMNPGDALYRGEALLA